MLEAVILIRNVPRAKMVVAEQGVTPYVACCDFGQNVNFDGCMHALDSLKS